MIKPQHFTICLALLLAFTSLRCQKTGHDVNEVFHPIGKKGIPNQSFLYQRTFPDQSFNLKAYENNLRSVKENLSSTKRGPVNFSTEWKLEGPGNLGGRVNSIAIHPENDNIILLGFSTGGIWKTINSGASWYPVFDEHLFSAIGDIVFDEDNPEIVYAGTGDPNMGSMPFVGDGLYKSSDGGESWNYSGLKDSRIISKISIHEVNNEKVIYVSALGLPFERDDRRGLYKSSDGGQSWQQKFFISDVTGVIDHVVDSQNPNIIYAAAWDHLRNNKESILDGVNSGIYKSSNGGDNWERMYIGLPEGSFSRIGLAISASNPKIIYASFIAKVDATVCLKEGYQLHSIYKSENSGQTWSEIDTDESSTGLTCNAMGGFGWYFGKIALNPIDDNELFILGVDLWKTNDQGSSWQRATAPWWEDGDVHVDMHDLAFTNSGKMFLGTDGGAYSSNDNAANWRDIEDIPTAQFYRVSHNPNRPDLYYGGTQDNGTIVGNGESLDNWSKIFGGDGFKANFHPQNANIFIVETQFGGLNITSNNGETFHTTLNGIDPEDKRNWDMPYLFSKGYVSTLYLGTDKIYRGVLSGVPLNVQWEPISEDLTNFRDGDNPQFHNITSISESPFNRSMIYASTSDGNVVRTINGGSDWQNISGGLPLRYVTCVKASPTLQKQNYVYVSHSGYRENKSLPHIHRSFDRGRNWESISSNLPEIAINDIYILGNNQDSVIFVATDGGVYATLNSGVFWKRLGSNMPIIPVLDLEYNPNDNLLIAGTYGRSLMTFELDSLNVSGDFSTSPKPTFAIVREYINIKPSPAVDYINVQFSNLEQERTTEIVLVDATGKLIQRKIGNFGSRVDVDFDISDLSAGSYLIAVKMRNSVYSSRFLKVNR